MAVRWLRCTHHHRTTLQTSGSWPHGHQLEHSSGAPYGLQNLNSSSSGERILHKVSPSPHVSANFTLSRRVKSTAVRNCKRFFEKRQASCSVDMTMFKFFLASNEPHRVFYLGNDIYNQIPISGRQCRRKLKKQYSFLVDLYAPIPHNRVLVTILDFVLPL